MMKNIFKMKLLLFVVVVVATSCTEGDHLIISGPPANSVNATNYDYLNSLPDNFSELIKVIDKTNLMDSINRDDVTFFALQNESIQAYLGSQDYASVEDAPVDSLSKVLLKYVIDGKMLREDYDTGGADFVTAGGNMMNVKIKLDEYKGVQNVGARNIILTDTKIYAELIELRISTAPAEALVTTGDIQTINGVIHVLETAHRFGF